jgi:hypothetical protein
LEGAETLYRVDGPEHFVEWQPFGESRWLRHQHMADLYPSQVLVQSIIQGEEGYQVLSSEQWKLRHRQRSESDDDKSVGVFAPMNQQREIKEGENLANWTTFGVSATTAFWMTALNDEDIRLP